jgi:hypothetical protein
MKNFFISDRTDETGPPQKKLNFNPEKILISKLKKRE